MDISLKSGGNKILSSGTVLSYGAESNIEFFIKAEGDEIAFKIILQFDNDSNDKRPHTQIRPNLEDKTIEITCYNFPKAGTTKEPMNLATIDEKKILMNFSVSRLSDSGIRQVVYTFYEG